MTRYHPILVALHWIMAIMILMALFFGKAVLEPMADENPEKIGALAGHMTIGLSLGALLILRLIMRFTSTNPPHAETGNALLDKLGVVTHWVLYLLIALMVASGLGIAFSAGLFPIVFGGSGDPLPDLWQFAPRTAHGAISGLLIVLVALHFVAALFHQFVLKDGLLRRMWFGKRREEP